MLFSVHDVAESLAVVLLIYIKKLNQIISWNA